MSNQRRPSRPTNARGAKEILQSFGSSISRFFRSIFVPRVRQPNYVFTTGVTILKLLVILILIVGVSGIGMVVGVAKAYYDTIPELDFDVLTSQNLSSFIYDRNGDLITVYRGLENRIWVKTDDIPDQVKNAFIAVEDARFYTHNGVDIKRIAGAFVNNMSNDSMQGGSTITQQLVKLRLLSTEQTYKRKIQEAYIAIELEKQVDDKSTILEWYLNTINLGDSNYGVLAASRDYFGKELEALSLRECATLAGITRNPTKYNPRRSIYTTDTPEVSVTRTNYVLQTMYENNFITQDEYKAAIGNTGDLRRSFEGGDLSQDAYRTRLVAQMSIIEKSRVSVLYPMPTAVETVLADVEDQLMLANGLPITDENRRTMRNQIQRGGYKIYSTIDPDLQLLVEDTVYNWEEYPSMAKESTATAREIGKDGTIYETIQPQVSVTIFDHAAGEIRAVVGSRTPPKGQLELNRVRIPRAVGSSIKPLAVYGPALDKGASPGSITQNMPVPIEGWEGGKGYPANSSSGNYKGYVTLRQAMRMSLNTAAANTLFDYVGLNDSYNYLVSMGVSPNGLQQTPFGLSLGASELSTNDMATAFGTIANKGTYQQPLTFTRVLDSSGDVVLDMKAKQQENKRQMFREGTAYMLTDMLVDAVRSGTGSHARIDGMTLGGKTGTNSDHKGVYFAGFTPYYSGAVWLGSDLDDPLNKVYGGRTAAPLWKAIMQRIHEEQALEDRPIIEDDPTKLGLLRADTCSLTGLLPTEACTVDANFPVVSDWWHVGTVPIDSCDKHANAPRCVETGQLAGPYCVNTSPGSAILEPMGSPAEQLTPEQLAKLLPNAILGVPEGYTLEQLRGDPNFLRFFCSIHTDQTQPGVGNGENGNQGFRLPGDSEGILSTPVG